MGLWESGVSRCVSGLPFVGSGGGSKKFMLVLRQARFGQANNVGRALEYGVLVVKEVGRVDELNNRVSWV